MQDSGTIPRSSIAIINIIGDPDVEFVPDFPAFDQNMYRGNLLRTGALTIEPITLDPNTYNPSIDFTLHGGNQSVIFLHFRL